MTDEPGGSARNQQASAATAADGAAAAVAANDASQGRNGTAGAADGAATASRPGKITQHSFHPIKRTNGMLNEPRCDVQFPRLVFFPFSFLSQPPPFASSLQKKRLRRVRALRPRPPLAAIQAKGSQEEDADAGLRGRGAVAAEAHRLPPPPPRGGE